MAFKSREPASCPLSRIFTVSGLGMAPFPAGIFKPITPSLWKRLSSKTSLTELLKISCAESLRSILAVTSNSDIVPSILCQPDRDANHPYVAGTCVKPSRSKIPIADLFLDYCSTIDKSDSKKADTVDGSVSKGMGARFIGNLIVTREFLICQSPGQFPYLNRHQHLSISYDIYCMM